MGVEASEQMQGGVYLQIFESLLSSKQVSAETTLSKNGVCLSHITRDRMVEFELGWWWAEGCEDLSIRNF